MCIRDSESVVVIENGTDTGKRSEYINNEVTENKVSNVVEISDDSNGERIANNYGVSLNAKHVAVDKVFNNVNYDDVNKVVENEVSKYDTVRNSGDNESMMRVEVRGVLVTFIELEREYEESFNVEWEQRANFPVMLVK